MIIRDIARLILAKSKAYCLPINIESIAKLYNLDKYIKPELNRYNNCCNVCREILKLYGMKDDKEFSERLAMHIMAPAIVLCKLSISSYHELAKITDIPLGKADECFDNLQKVSRVKVAELSKIEKAVLKNFSEWIDNHRLDIE